MSFDLMALARESAASANRLHAEHGNPAWAKVISDLMRVGEGYASAKGAYVFDRAGRRYLDFLGGFGVMNFGHNHPVITRAVADAALSDLPNMLQVDTPVLEGLLARELTKRAPDPLTNVFFGSSGAEAVEAAIKFARRATGRPTIISTDRAYHGLSMGALALMGTDKLKKSFEPMMPSTRRIPFNDLGALEHALSAKDTAAFIVEPIQGEGGVIMPLPEYLPEAKRLCAKAGALLVFDEIQVGMGRTGRFFAFEHYNVVPDMVLLAKALSGGLVPVSALISTRKIFDKVYNSLDNATVHASTFGGNNLAMAAGLASLHVLTADRLLENAAARGRFLKNELLRRVASYETIKDVRGEGLMIGIEFGAPRSAALRANWALMHAVDGLFGAGITLGLLQDHRVITTSATHNYDVLKLTPPLMVGETEIREFLAAFDAHMEKVHRFAEPVVDLAKRLGRLLSPPGKDVAR